MERKGQSGRSILAYSITKFYQIDSGLCSFVHSFYAQLPAQVEASTWQAGVVKTGYESSIL